MTFIFLIIIFLIILHPPTGNRYYLYLEKNKQGLINQLEKPLTTGKWERTQK